MWLCDADIERLAIREPVQVKDAMDWWKSQEWEKIGERILIDPFDASNVHPVSYELTVGGEWVSLRDPYTVRQIAPAGVIAIPPHETILVLTEEYIALPKTIGGIVVPRARKLFEGSALAATRVEPTWHGKLVVGFTNQSQYTTSLGRGERFCNLILLRTGEVRRPLSKLSTPHLGRTTMGKPEYPSLRPQQLRTPDQVSANDIREMVQRFGAPFDVVVGGLEETKKEVLRAIEKDIGPRMVDTAVTQAVKKAFKTQQLMFGILLAEFGILVAGLLTFLLRR